MNIKKILMWLTDEHTPAILIRQWLSLNNTCSRISFSCQKYYVFGRHLIKGSKPTRLSLTGSANISTIGAKNIFKTSKTIWASAQMTSSNTDLFHLRCILYEVDYVITNSRFFLYKNKNWQVKWNCAFNTMGNGLNWWYYIKRHSMLKHITCIPVLAYLYGAVPEWNIIQLRPIHSTFESVSTDWKNLGNACREVFRLCRYGLRLLHTRW